MERRGVVIGALAVAAVALAAGSVSPSTAPAGGGGATFGAGAGSGGVALGGVLWLAVLAALVAGGGWLLVARLRSDGGGGRRLRRRFLALVLAVGVVVAGVLLVAVRVFEDGEGPGGPDGVGGPLVQGSPESLTSTGGPGPGVILAVLVVLALLVGGWLAVRRLRAGGDADREADAASAASDEDDPDDPGTDGVDGTTLGAAAGRAAAHLDDAGSPPENDVVRAWRELAAVLPVARPETSTPREFASAATAAGVDPDAVAELTALFEAVRYGDRDPTGERAERAVAALERIEAEHGTSEPPEDAAGAGTEGDEAGERGGSR